MPKALEIDVLNPFITNRIQSIVDKRQLANVISVVLDLLLWMVSFHLVIIGITTIQNVRRNYI